MKIIEVGCTFCGDKVTKPLKEYTRSKKLGRLFFCNNSCSTSYKNLGRKARIVEKVCPNCGNTFLGSTKKKSKTYCTAGCASSHSYYRSGPRMEAARKYGELNKGNLNSPFETLRKRESWKYKDLGQFLLDIGIEYEFEFPLKEFVFDLHIRPDILVEFDDPYHDFPSQKVIDEIKDKTAFESGYSIVRIKVNKNSTIPVQSFVDSMSVNG